MTPVLAAAPWKTNAHLIADVVRLGYIREGDRVLDPTFHLGTWWNAVDLDTIELFALSDELDSEAFVDGHDFRSMPFEDKSFDVIAFDPPYVSKGGRSTSGIKEMDTRYGQHTAPPTPALLQDLINDGLTESVRLARRVVLVKCKDYVSSGRLWIGTHRTLTHALDLGCELLDRFEHLSGVGPQPPGRRQVHARRNLTTLLVLRPPKTKES